MNIRYISAIGLFSAITSILAQITVPLPFTPVPVTFQVLAVCLSSAILGKKLGTISQVVYILLGAVGVPVFSSGKAGLQTILGPTGGFLLGFIAAAYVIGILVETRTIPTYESTALSMLAGLVIIYSAGTIHLSFEAGIELAVAFKAGVLPFIWLDVIKIAVGAYIACAVRKALIKQNLIINI